MKVSDLFGPLPLESVQPPRRSEPAVEAIGIDLDPDTHVYTVDGVEQPSVSQILAVAGLKPDMNAVPEYILETARQRGIAIHSACEYIDQGVLELDSIDPQIRGYITAYDLFLRSSTYQAEATEERVYHRQLGYCGTLDMRGRLNNVRCIIDRKATASMTRHTAVQVAAYRLAYNSMRPTTPAMMDYGLQLRPDGTYRLKHYDNPQAELVWLAAVEVYKHPDSPAAVAGRGVLEQWKAKRR